MVPRNDEERELFELFNTAIGYGLSNEDAVRRMIENYRDGNFTFGHYANLWRGRNAAAARGVNAAAARVEPAPVRPGLGREATGLHLLLWPSSSAPVAKSTAPAGLPPLVLKAKVSGELLDVVVAMSAGERNAECSICFEYLHEQPQGQLCCGPAQRAACGHFFHHACALNLLNSNTRTSRKCPICRASYDRVKPVPQLTADPDGWFAAVDTGGEGYLSRRQVLNVLVAQYPVDLVKLEESFDELWERWDVTESGYLTKAEFVHPERGLLNFVRANLLHEPVVAPASPEPSPSAATHAATGTSSLAQPPSPVPPSPRPAGVRSNEDSNAPRTPSTIMHAYAPPAWSESLEEEGARWFAAYDDTRSGMLTRDQMLRALVKSVPRATLEIAETVLQRLAAQLPELGLGVSLALSAAALEDYTGGGSSGCGGGGSSGAAGAASRARAAEAITLEQFLTARLYLSIDEVLPEGLSPRTPREGEAPPSRRRDWYSREGLSVGSGHWSTA